MIPVKVKTSPGAMVPKYQSKGSAGADLYAFLDEAVIIKPGETKLIPTGIFLEIPFGYEAQIRPRSGLALKNGLTFLNSPGTIDSDYRGEIKVIVTNLGQQKFTVTNHLRIAQIIFNKVYQAHFLPKTDLNKTTRNEGGFGHTGL